LGAPGFEPFETSIAPWPAVNDAQKAVEFYRAAFGAAEITRLDDGGRVVVAQLSVGEAAFWVQEDADAGPTPQGWDRFG
jgi:PhnB protein